MRILLLLVGCIAIALAACPASADAFTEAQPFYTQVGQNCGEGGSKRTYSKAEYARALSEATKAQKTAKGARLTAIRQSIADVKDCEKSGYITPPPPPIFSCGEMVYDYQTFLKSVSGSKLTAKQVAAKKQAMAKAFAPCLQKALSKCIDPKDTKQFYETVSLLDMAEGLGFFGSISTDKATSYPISAPVPLPGGMARLSFCTDTDFTCQGILALCPSKVDTLKRLMTIRK